MFHTALLVGLVAASAPVTAQANQSFEAFLTKYRAAPVAARAPLLRTWVDRRTAGGGFPVVEAGGDVVFVFAGRGGEREVRVVGDFQARNFASVLWDEAGLALTRAAPGAPLFFLRHRFEPDARLDYRFVVDGQQVLDALNPRRLSSGAAPLKPGEQVAEVSELVMPRFAGSTSYLLRPDVPHGRLEQVTEPWATPKVTVYLPPGLASGRRCPSLYVADGSSWIKWMSLPLTLDNLIAAGAIPPVIAIFIDPASDRHSWYQLDSAHLPYLERVVAHIDAHHQTEASPRSRVFLGSSAGGRAALNVGLSRPQLFGNVALLSPSVTGSPRFYAPYLTGKRRPDPRLRIWLSAGTYEGYIHEDVRFLDGYFRSVGLSPVTVITHQGHSLGNFRSLAEPALRHLLGRPR
jgi:enterochelin esterase family protein